MLYGWWPAHLRTFAGALNLGDLISASASSGSALASSLNCLSASSSWLALSSACPRAARVRASSGPYRGALIGCNSLLGLLQLVISPAKGKLFLGAAVGQWHVLNDFGGMGQIAALGIEAASSESPPLSPARSIALS